MMQPQSGHGNKRVTRFGIEKAQSTLRPLRLSKAVSSPRPYRAACPLCDNCDGQSRQPWRPVSGRGLALLSCDRKVREASMRSGLLSMFLLSLVATAATPQTQLHELIARAKSLELDTPYVPPPGDPLAHHAAGYAKVMCTAVFMTGLAPDFAAENVGYFTAPYGIRTKLGRPVIDRTNQAVHVTLPNGVTRTAKYLGSQGCVTLPLGKSAVHFTPVVVKSKLPDADTMPCRRRPWSCELTQCIGCGCHPADENSGNALSDENAVRDPKVSLHQYGQPSRHRL